MHISAFAKGALVLTALLAGAHAVPPTIKRSADASINDCGDSSFTDESSSGSPRIVDCQQIQANIAGGGTWTTLADGTPRQLVSYGTCAFNVEATGTDIFRVGNQDIIDLINSSIEKYSWNGLVGAKGTMPCQIDLQSGDVSVNWGLYHT